jgi:DNA-binding XRE family transcriptional regulator
MLDRKHSKGKTRPMKKLFLHEQERFWDNVKFKKKPEVCWKWKGQPNTNGYGVFSFRGNVYKAHRVAYFLANGRINDDMLVLHSCDVRLCCNPKHLYQGDPKQNAADTIERGRHTRMYGEQNGKAKLTKRQVRSIRHRYQKGGITQKTLAQYYGVGETTIYYICTGERWINLFEELKAS